MKYDDAPKNTSPWGDQIYDHHGNLATPRERASDDAFSAVRSITIPFAWDRPGTDDKKLWDCLERLVDRKRYGLTEAAIRDLEQALILTIKLAGEQAIIDVRDDDGSVNPLESRACAG